MRGDRFRLFAIAFSVALLMAACSSDNGSDGSSGMGTYRETGR